MFFVKSINIIYCEKIDYVKLDSSVYKTIKALGHDDIKRESIVSWNSSLNLFQSVVDKYSFNTKLQEFIKDVIDLVKD